MIQQVLEETRRFHATVVNSGAQAIEAVSRATFDIALVESALEDLSLRDLVAALRLTQPSMAVVVILPFGEQTLPDAAKFFDVQGILSKPLYIPDLQSQIEEALTRPVNGATPPRAVAPAPPAKQPGPAVEIPAARSPAARRPAPPPAWLEDVNRAAQYLTTLTLESSAEAALLMRGQHLIAFAGQGGQAEADELSRAVAASWAKDGDSGQGAQVRFLRLSDGADYLVYSTLAAQDVVLSMAFKAETPLGQIRKQAKRATSALFAAPAAPEPPTSPAPAANAPEAPAPPPTAPSSAPALSIGSAGSGSQAGPALSAKLTETLTPAAPPAPVATPQPAAPHSPPAADGPAPPATPGPMNSPALTGSTFAKPATTAPPSAAADRLAKTTPLSYDPALYESILLAESAPPRPAPSVNILSRPPATETPAVSRPDSAPPSAAHEISRMYTKRLPPLPDFAPDILGFLDPPGYPDAASAPPAEPDLGTKPLAEPNLDTKPLAELGESHTPPDAVHLPAASVLPPALAEGSANQTDVLQAWANLYRTDIPAPVIEPPAPFDRGTLSTPAPVESLPSFLAPDQAVRPAVVDKRLPPSAVEPADKPASLEKLPATADHDSDDRPAAVDPLQPAAAAQQDWSALPSSALAEPAAPTRESTPVALPDWRNLPPRLPTDLPLVPAPAEAQTDTGPLTLPAVDTSEPAGEEEETQVNWAAMPPTEPLPDLPDWVPAGSDLLAREILGPAQAEPEVEPLPDAESLEALSLQLRQLERQSVVEQPTLLDLAPAPWPHIRRTPHGLYDLSYSFIFVPRLGHVNLSGDLKARLEHWLISLAEVHEWEATTIAVESDHVELSLKCPPADSPERIMKTILVETSDKILAEYPRLAGAHAKRPASFWASGYYVVTPGRRFIPEEVRAYVEYQRREQSGKL
jgi:REP element-mobilizing transposase RayT